MCMTVKVPAPGAGERGTDYFRKSAIFTSGHANCKHCAFGIRLPLQHKN
jgi:hypothetical protein